METIKLDAEIDATDQLEQGQAAEAGIYPQLAALEIIVYPTSAQLAANNAKAKSGTLEITPMIAPLTLFVWSKNRVVPVRITDFSITEEAFDPTLNPIRAKVSLSMRVLSVDDLGFDSKGGSVYMSYQQQKERLATLSAGAHAQHARPGRAAMNPANDPNAALQALLGGAGLKASLFPPNSRYAGLDVAALQRPDGTTLVYVRRRFISPPERFALLQEHVVVEGERLDNLAATLSRRPGTVLAAVRRQRAS